MARSANEIMEELFMLLPAFGHAKPEPSSAIYQLLSAVASQLHRSEQEIEALKIQLSYITPEKIAEAVWGTSPIPQIVDKEEVTKRIMERLEAPWKVTK